MPSGVSVDLSDMYSKACRMSNSLTSMTSSAHMHAIITLHMHVQIGHSTRIVVSRNRKQYHKLLIPTSPVKMPTNTTTSSEPLFFWRESEKPYGFLSQWYDSPFEVEGVTYASTEMWMMIQKAKLFGDEVYPAALFNGKSQIHSHVSLTSTQETAEKMMQTTVPSEHQALGRKAKGFNRPKWDERELITFSLHKTRITDSDVRQKPHRRRRQLPQIYQRQRKLLDGQEAT